MRYSLEDIAKAIGGIIEGDKTLKVNRLMPFFDAEEDDITFAADEKFLKEVEKSKAKVILTPNIDNLPKGKTYIKINQNPREVMPILLGFFKKKTKQFIKSIEDSAIIGKNVSISPNCYIGHDVEIGENTIIYPNVTILEGVKIGKNSMIYSGTVIREFCELGDNVIIQPGAVIGSDGFGYIKVNNKNLKLEQIGRVLIEENVEIGANAAIDRGAIGDTVIKRGTKIDNLVHLAHNDKIGENCIIVAQVGMAGSVEIGDNVTIAGQVGVAGHLKVGDNVIIAAKSGVTKDVPSGSKMSGFPLRDHKEDLKIKVAMGKLPQLLKQIKELEKKLGGK